MALLNLLTVVVCSAYVLLMISYLYAWKKELPFSSQRTGGRAAFCTIIIPARNEEHNILQCLDSIYRQKYPLSDFEVIVVDDHSTDKTFDLVASKQHQNLKLIRLSETQMGKKQAIAEGIKSAAGDLIITTDADCTRGENWLSTIISFYEEKRPKMIVAPVLLQEESSFSEIMQSQEMTVLTACASASIYLNTPILCSGANLAFEKTAFHEVNGYEGVDKTATGDDMFLMLKMHKKFPNRIGYLKSKEAVVFTHAENSSSKALRQRKRWASKSFSYSLKDESTQKRDGFSHVTGVAMLIFFTNFLILISGIMSAINLKFVLILVLCLSAKILVDFMLLYTASSFFGKKIHPIVFAIASVVYPVYVSITGLISPFTNYSWKSRRS